MQKYFLVLLVAAIGFASCTKDQLKADKQAIEDYLAQNNIDAIPHASGLYYIIEEEGTGTEFPTLTSDVEVKYKGYLTDGRVFDETKTGPVEFLLNQVIEGWQIGIPLFKVGSKGKLFIPSDLAYGNNGVGIISPNSVLIFDVEIVGLNKTSKYLQANNITAERHPYGLYYVIDEEGTGTNYPNINSRVTVKYKGSLTDGKVFDQTDSTAVSFYLTQVIDGWKVGIPLFKKGGKGTLYIPSYLAYGSKGRVEQDSTIIPPNATLIFDVELVDFQ